MGSSQQDVHLKVNTFYFQTQKLSFFYNHITKQAKKSDIIELTNCEVKLHTASLATETKVKQS